MNRFVIAAVIAAIGAPAAIASVPHTAQDAATVRATIWR